MARARFDRWEDLPLDSVHPGKVWQELLNFTEIRIDLREPEKSLTSKRVYIGGNSEVYRAS